MDVFIYCEVQLPCPASTGRRRVDWTEFTGGVGRGALEDSGGTAAEGKRVASRVKSGGDAGVGGQTRAEVGSPPGGRIRRAERRTECAAFVSCPRPPHWQRRQGQPQCPSRPAEGAWKAQGWQFVGTR
ncbi:hypothetical protein COCON_G00221940 [Conger conger]|uniref:Uncharacterized protein n=1 Tax=Conger conger TaxID=82655 RepID=A0A9Q1CWK4_CONCO|nr:hypothetical protein COCON_G00221940 [Conger conger]